MRESNFIFDFSELDRHILENKYAIRIHSEEFAVAVEVLDKVGNLVSYECQLDIQHALIHAEYTIREDELELEPELSYYEDYQIAQQYEKLNYLIIHGCIIICKNSGGIIKTSIINSNGVVFTPRVFTYCLSDALAGIESSLTNERCMIFLYTK